MKRASMLLIVSLVASPVFAAGLLPPGLRACKGVQDSLQRLVCYDKQMAELDSEVMQFGQESLVQKSQPANEAVPSSLSSTITGVRLASVGVYVITLENGQVWRQQEAVQGFYPGTGDTAHIEKGALGSFRLMSEGRGGRRWVRVARVK
jgi:hypothetical protein